MLLVFAFPFLYRLYGTTAAPVSPLSCFPEPRGYETSILTRDDCPACLCDLRSVWDIVWSCLATTFAVTWVSVHPNVPFLEETSWMVRRRRIFLMCLALLAPEVMILWAFKQWRGAAVIRETVNKSLPESCTYCFWEYIVCQYLHYDRYTLDDDPCSSPSNGWLQSARN